MPAIIAIKSGNWSDPTVWHIGRIPEVDDVVYANTYTVTIDVSTTVQRLSNSIFFGLNTVPIMTGYTTSSGIASAQTEYGFPYLAWKAFDGNWTGNDNHWVGGNGRPLPEWLQYEFASPKVIVGYSLQTTVYDVNRATNWEFQAWNGTDWIVLDTNVGSPSQAVPYVRTFTNSTAYSRYRIFITNSLRSDYLSIGELRLFETATDAQNAVTGGVFVLNPNITLNCTESIEASNTTILSWAGGSGTTTTVNSPLLLSSTSGITFLITGTGTLNINIALTTAPPLNSINSIFYEIRGAGIINIVGTLTPRANFSLSGNMLNITNTATGAIVNLTGELTQIRGVGQTACSINSNVTLNITGPVTLGMLSWPFNITTFCTVNITGTLTGFDGTQLGLLVYDTAILKIVGPIITTGNMCTIYAPSGNTINLFSGPFVYSSHGFSPLWVTRYHLITSTTTYIQFRDSTTDGAAFPGLIAPTALYISPAATSDVPLESDVRLGVNYALGSQTGTLNMPHPNQVTFGVAVDNTFGNAVLTAASVWDYLVSNITVEGSIGMRLKNVATPQSVGEQLEAFLRLD
jgi:hypothetical protein